MSSPVISWDCSIAGIRNLDLFDAQGRSVTFGSVLDQEATKVNRILVVFIRHFFCGNCQEYVRRLTTDLAPSTLPEDLSLVIIGCGAPSLIPSYLDLTQCPFSLYADPSTRLYKHLGMRKSLSLGSKDPDYIQHSIASGVVKSIVQGLKRIPSGDFAKAGDMSVNGGEFLFGRKDKDSKWSISWSHCMMNSRDHTEISMLKVQLGMRSTSETDMTAPGSARGSFTSLESATCQEGLSCGEETGNVKRSTSVRRSWVPKAGDLGRSLSIGRNMIDVS